MTLPTGSRLGPYEIGEMIGRGGMGEVYRASDTRLGREVAVKVLSSHLADDPASLVRFKREARAVSRLTHAGLVRIHSLDWVSGVLLLDMELVRGTSLLRVLQEKVFRRVGGTVDMETEVRVVAATNQNLMERVKGGQFREDLYHRLSRVVIELPAEIEGDDPTSAGA